MENLTGHSLKGYELLERIGSGGYGAVYRAYQSTIGREVAVKVILPHFANRPDFIRRFEAEAQLVARLEHLHIVPLIIGAIPAARTSSCAGCAAAPSRTLWAMARLTWSLLHGCSTKLPPPSPWPTQPASSTAI